MFTSPLKLTGISVAVLSALLSSATLASADPGKGLRWSDFAWGPSRTTTTRTAPTYYSTQAYGYAIAPQSTATGGTVAPLTTGQTIAIRGSDGVVRVYPVVGGVVQQLPTQSTVGAQGSTVTGGSSSNPSVVIPSTTVPRRR